MCLRSVWQEIFLLLFVLRKGKVTRRCTLEMSVYSILNLELLMKSLLWLIDDMPVRFSFKRIEVQSSQGYLPYHIRREVKNTKETVILNGSVLLFIKYFVSVENHIMRWHSDLITFCYCCAMKLFCVRELLLHLLCGTIPFSIYLYFGEWQEKKTCDFFGFEADLKKYLLFLDESLNVIGWKKLISEFKYQSSSKRCIKKKTLQIAPVSCIYSAIPMLLHHSAF